MHEMSDWSSLERGLLRDVFTRLPDDVDAVSFRCVCHHWRAAAGDGAPVARPWFALLPLVVGGGATYLQPTTARRHDDDGRTCVRAIRVEEKDDTAVKAVAPGRSPPRAPRAVVVGVSRGWHAVNEGGRLLLRDPISRTEVPLPAVYPACELFGVFLSDDTLAAPGGGCTVFAFLRRTGCDYSGHVLAFYRPGGDAEEWTQIDPDDSLPSNVRLYYRGLEFFRGRAYVLLQDYRLAVCDVSARRLVVTTVRVDYPPYEESYSQDGLVECGGDLLFAQVRQILVGLAGWQPCCVGRCTNDNGFRFSSRVAKIELDPDGVPVSLSNVEEGIGDHAVFLTSRWHAFALPASGFPAVKAGCIYHFSTHLGTNNVFGMVVSDLRQRPHRHEEVRKLPTVGRYRPLSWFCPRAPVLGTVAAAAKRR